MRLYKNVNLIASEFKKNNDIATAKNFIRTTKPSQMTNEQNLENIFQKDYKKLISMNKDEIEKEASNWSQNF
jgi:DNA replication initiation complex subunit (GINS family)